MPFDFSRGLRGALSTGSATLATGNPWMIGASALAGLLSGFGPSIEDEYRQREQYLIDRATEIYNRIRREGSADITSQTAQLAQAAGRGATRRARSLGREGQIESYTAPAVGQATAAGERALTDFLLGTSRAEGEAKLGASQAYVGRPIQPSVADILGAAAPAIGQGISQMTLNRALRKYYGLDQEQPTDLSGLDIGVSPRTGASPGFAITPRVSPGTEMMRSYRDELYGSPSQDFSRPVPQQTLDLSSMLMGAGRAPNWLFPRRRGGYSLDFNLNRPMRTRPVQTRARPFSSGWYTQPEELFGEGERP